MSEDNNFYHSSKNTFQEAILININQNEIGYDEQETEADLIDLKDELFHKAVSSYSERTDFRGGSSSRIRSTLTFRQDIRSSGGKQKKTKGASDPTHRENLQNFEKAGIPIDPIKDPRKKPDDFNKWRWNKDKKQCSLQGEHKAKLINWKIVAEKEWQRILIHKSRQA